MGGLSLLANFLERVVAADESPQYFCQFDAFFHKSFCRNLVVCCGGIKRIVMKELACFVFLIRGHFMNS